MAAVAGPRGPAARQHHPARARPARRGRRHRRHTRTALHCPLSRPVAMAGRERFTLAPHVAERPDGDPLKTFVCFLVLYAREILTGGLPGEPRRYLPARAERYARECLLAPADFL